jgi:hypothetical protein
MSLTYANLSRRFQYAVQGYSQTQFFYGQAGGVFLDPSLAPFLTRDQAVATRSVRGGSAYGIYPLTRYRRVEMTASLFNINEEYDDPQLQQAAENFQTQRFGTRVFRNGTLVPFGVTFVQETTVFREFGPLAGNTMRVAYDVAPKIFGSLSRQTIDADFRHYLRIAGTGVLATRLRGFRSFGDAPDFMYFGGNSELRGYDYLQFTGSRTLFANAELRFPLIEAALTPIGVIGGIRGVFFAGIGGAWFENQPSGDPCGADPTNPSGRYQFATSNTEVCSPITGYQTDPVTGSPLFDAQGNPVLAHGAPKAISGWRLKDGRASYGLGLETFALGFPIHFDWSWRTLFNKDWEDVLFATNGGSSKFRKPQFAVWVGYDF